MTVWKLVLREICHRRWNFASALVSVSVAVACLIGTLTVLRIDRDRTQAILDEKQQAVQTAGAELEDAMREVLSDDEFALYQAYEAESEERMMRQGMEMQMGMLGAQGMTTENQALVMDTIMEEFSLLQTQDLDPVAGMQ